MLEITNYTFSAFAAFYLAITTLKRPSFQALVKSILWRGEPPEVDFYAFWRVRLALHVTAKGIYIPGFCTSTFIHIHS
jgi:hypothetical protein